MNTQDSTESGLCSQCGGPATVSLGGKEWCEDCYYVRGSCCMEMGGNDYWAPFSDNACDSGVSGGTDSVSGPATVKEG